jgi:hypothetical protein
MYGTTIAPSAPGLENPVKLTSHSKKKRKM